jgi:hypothetical protein
LIDFTNQTNDILRLPGNTLLQGVSYKFHACGHDKHGDSCEDIIVNVISDSSINSSINAIGKLDHHVKIGESISLRCDVERELVRQNVEF